MSTNRQLLKEAIADAKTVKDTAIANAKIALEEAFTPYLKEKLSAKLAEMEEEDVTNEDTSDNTEDSVDEISLDELLAEIDENEETPDLEEAKKKEEEVSIEDMSEDDLKSFVEDVIKDMVTAGELEAGESKEEEGEDAEEEINLDELMGSSPDYDGYNTKVKDNTPKSKNSIFTKAKDDYVTDDTEEDDAPVSKEKADKISFKEISAADSGADVSGDNEAIQAIAKALDISIEVIKKHWKDLKGAMANIGTAAMSSKGKAYEGEIEEAHNTINILRSELNEINLLNAKLLYTNKIFRNKSLNESQKVKVLTMFDKAKSKKEVELVYETLTESLKVSMKAPIKESLGSASKTLGNGISKTNIIAEDAFSRMRELAFGKTTK